MKPPAWERVRPARRLAVLLIAICAAVQLAAPARRAVSPVPAAAPAAPAAPAPPAHQEQRFDQAQISLWLRPLARVLHVSTDALWAVVIWLNFAALVYFLYYLLCRLKGWSLGRQMRGRTQHIQRKLAEADEAKSEADERLRSIERRLENLRHEVAALRDQAAAEAEAEYRRLGAESATEAEKIARFAAQHIEAAAKAARQQLRQYAGELAVNMAERQLRRQVTPELDRHVVRVSVEDIAADRRARS